MMSRPIVGFRNFRHVSSCIVGHMRCTELDGADFVGFVVGSQLTEIPTAVPVIILLERVPVPQGIQVPVFGEVLIRTDGRVGSVQVASSGIDQPMQTIIRIEFVMMKTVVRRDHVFSP